MSECCMHNPYDECFRSCEGCVRYDPDEEVSCDYCGEELDLYDFGGRYVCDYCLKNEVIGKDRVKDKDAVLHFIKQNADDFNEFAKRWFDCEPSLYCDNCVSTLIIDEDGEIKDFQALLEFLSEYDDLFQEFIEDWFSLRKVG